MNKTPLAIIALCSVLIQPSCAWLPVGIAPSNTPIEGRPYTKLERITVSDSKYVLFGFIPLSGSNRLENAVEKAKQESGGDALIDVVVEYRYAWYIIISRFSDYVTATPIRFAKERTTSFSDKKPVTAPALDLDLNTPAATKNPGAVVPNGDH